MNPDLPAWIREARAALLAACPGHVWELGLGDPQLRCVRCSARQRVRRDR